MKIETSEDTKKTFEPIKLTITIESEDELKGLWARTEPSAWKVNDRTDNKNMHSEWSAWELWDKIDDICKARGLK